MPCQGQTRFKELPPDEEKLFFLPQLLPITPISGDLVTILMKTYLLVFNE